MNDNNKEDYNIKNDEIFHSMAIDAMLDIGLTEDEADIMLDDYLTMY